jgi:hypothetical protein
VKSGETIVPTKPVKKAIIEPLYLEKEQMVIRRLLLLPRL